MNIQLLKLFYDVAQYGSINRAAQINYMSPSNVSRSMQELERLTHTVLFNRSHAGMKLTHQGEEFMMMVLPILQSVEQLEQAYYDEDSMQDLVSLTICAQQNSILTQCLIEFYNLYAVPAKYVNIVMSAYSSFEETTDVMVKKRYMLGAVQYNSVQETDIMYLLNSKHLEVLCRKSTQVHVVLNAAHPLAARESLTLDDLRGYTRIAYINESVPDINYCTDVNNHAWSKAMRRILIKERGQLINLLEHTDAYFLGTSACGLMRSAALIKNVPLMGMENEPVTVLLGHQNHILNINAQRFLDIFRKVVAEM